MNSTVLWFYKLLTGWLPESRGFGWKNFLLRRAGAKIGRNVRVYSSAHILGTGSLTIGDDVHVGPDVLISVAAPAGVTIGSHVDIAPGVMILTGSHEIDPQGEHLAGKGTAASVTIGAGSWLCARSVILSGVTLPEKTLVAAGAVVAQSIATPASLLAGVPAQVKKQYATTGN